MRLRRARPLLGTFVRVEAQGAEAAGLERAAAAAFAAVAAVHAAMRCHEPGSELTRLTRRPAGRPFPLSPALACVLDVARDVAEASDGAFDPVRAAAAAVGSRALPRPEGRAPDPTADWRDVELREGGAVAWLRRPLWIDLGGVAKGYAVDVAVEALRAHGAMGGLVDAGGDLRAFGPATTVVLDARAPGRPAPQLKLQDAALASSGGLAPAEGLAAQAHVDGRDGRSVEGAFAAVTAPRAVLADALTKAVLADGAGSEAALRRFGASALRLARGGAWTALGADGAQAAA